ncbi:unnamed protein product [Chrysoparadoxa australica]
MEACGPRRHPLLLPVDQVYACHAAAMVHHRMGWSHHEVGHVDIKRLRQTFDAAMSCGFQLPITPSSATCSTGAAVAAASPTTHASVIIVGAGASGLATAAALRRKGVHDVIVLEKNSKVGGSWARQYDSLCITTRKRHCTLPGYAVPDEYPVTLDAASFLQYLSDYAARYHIKPKFDCEVLSTSSGSGKDGCPRVTLGTSLGTFHCDALVVATGKHSQPRMPADVVEVLRNFQGPVLHSTELRRGAWGPMADLLGAESGVMQSGQVCIVGMGNSACDLAIELVKRGTGKVIISVRAAPPIIMREWGPLSLEWVTKLLAQYLPASFGDFMIDLAGKLRWGWNWRETVFPRDALSQSWQACKTSRVPVIDKGDLVDNLLKKRRLSVRPSIIGSSSGALQFSDSGEWFNFDAVILATGFEQAWHGITAGAGVHMVGFENGKALIPLLQIGKDAQAAAKAIAKAVR